jgi:hypothetical protein
MTEKIDIEGLKTRLNDSQSRQLFELKGLTESVVLEMLLGINGRVGGVYNVWDDEKKKAITLCIFDGNHSQWMIWIQKIVSENQESEGDE